MKTVKFNSDLLFPVFYNNGLLFRWVDGEFFLFKDNQITSLKENDLIDKEVKYPDNIQEILALKNALELIYNRILISQKKPEEYKLFEILKNIISEIEKTNEKLNYEKLKIRFEDIS